MKSLRVSLALILAFASAAPAFAADDGGQPGQFLNYAASARSLGMGQAFTAVADDASAVYFNPAGVAQMQRQNLVAQFSTLLENSAIGFLGYSHPLTHGGLGLGIVTLNSGDITRRDDQGNNTGSYTTSSMAGLLSGAISATNALSIGTTAKVVRESVADASGVGFGLDLSAMLQATSRIKFGLMARNLVAPSVKLSQDAESFPRSVTGGIAVKPAQPLTVGLDIEQVSGSSTRPRLGAEYLINNIIGVRAGVTKSEFSAGLGVGVGEWNFDYALGYSRGSSDVRDLGAFHRFGLQFSFGPPIQRSSALAEVAPAAPPPVAVAPPAIEKPVRTRHVRTKTPKAAPAAAAVATAKAKPAPKPSRAVIALHALGDQMDNWNGVPSDALQNQVDIVNRHLKKGDYLKPEDIYAAQGYVAYFTGEYASSARSLEKAVDAAPKDEALSRRLQMARDQVLKASKANKAAPHNETPELAAVREKFEAGDWNGTIVLAQRLLETYPNNKDAVDYQRKALDHLVQPRLRQAKDLLDADRFTEAFILFQKVLDYEPDNAEAKAYSARVVQIIEKKSDMDSSSRAVPRTETTVWQGLSLYEKGLRLYAHGDVEGANNAWENALLQVKPYPLVYDTVRSTLAELGHPAAR